MRLLHKYLKQERDWDCGPVALVNAQIWAENGYLFPKDHEPIFTLPELINSAPFALHSTKDGTGDWHMDKMLRRWGNGISQYAVKMKKQWTPEIVANHLLSGGAVVLAHLEPWTSEPEPHYSLWTGCLCDKFFYGWNVAPGFGLWITTYAGLQKMFDKLRDETEPYPAWLLTRRPND